MSNQLHWLLPGDQIFFLEEKERFPVLAEMNRLLQEKSGCAAEVAGQMIEREKVLTTAIGNHIAIPHARSDSINRLNVLLGVSRTGVAWDAIDQLPVHLVFVVTAPLHLNKDYLHLLADIVRHFKDIRQVQQLITLEEEEELRQQVQQIINR